MALNGKGLGKFQISRTFTSWKGLTRENHLGSIFQSQPQKASNTMVRLFAAQNGKTLDTFLSQFPTRQFDTDDEFTWSVIGTTRRNIPLLEARDEDGAVVGGAGYTKTMVGAGVAPFYLVFSEDWFADGEYIVGNLNELYQFRILGDPRAEGTNYVYKVELAGGNTTGVPVERLLAGEKFSIEAAFIERELSRKVGDIRFSTPTAMRNEFSQIRIQHKAPGSMIDRKLMVGIPFIDPNTGKELVKNLWMHVVDYELEVQFQEYKNNAIMFGRSNRTANGEYLNIGKSGSVIKTGAGLLEQMECANTEFYNTFSLKRLEDALFQLSTASRGLGERKFVIKTGERGAIQFHKAVLNSISGWSQFQYDGTTVKVIEKTQSTLHQTALAAGFQFVEWRAPNGVVVKLDVDPWYDDPIRNKVVHPDGGVAQSYRYDIMDLGSSEQPNIFKCAVKNRPDYRGYQWGPFRNPFTGGTNNPYASYDEDSAVIHKMSTLGVCVLDPTRTMSLIPAILQG